MIQRRLACQEFSAPVTDSENWPRLVQIAWQLHNDMGELVEVKNYIVRPMVLQFLIMPRKFMEYLQKEL